MMAVIPIHTRKHTEVVSQQNSNDAQVAVSQENYDTKGTLGRWQQGGAAQAGASQAQQI
jgi:hypothetical protein